MNRLLSISLTATLLLTMPAGAAFAITSYDARTLGMGGSSIGYSGNASLAFWNPAAVGVGRNIGVFLPTLSVSLSNNLLSPSDIQLLASGLNTIGKTPAAGALPSDFTAIFNNLGSSQGLNLQGEALVEPIGLALGQVGPGSLAFRLYGHGVANAKLSLSSDFAQNLNGLFFQGGFTNIAAAVNNLSKEASNASNSSQAALAKDVAALKTQLTTNMSSFIKHNGEKTTTKSLSLNESVGLDAAAAFTYAQVIPVKIAALPKSQITVGATAKIFGSPGSLLGSIGQFTLPGGSGSEKISPVGGGAGAEVNLNIDKQVTDLTDAIDNFQKDQNIATTADLASKTGAFFTDGLGHSTLQFSSLTPDNVGAGLDLGAAMKIDDQWSVGVSLINPLLFWNATKSSYTYDFSGDNIQLKRLAPDQKVTFSAAEPFVARIGAAFQPQFPASAPAIARGLLFNAGVEAPFNNGQPASVMLGVEKIFADVFAVRLGTSQLGIAPLYTAGIGIQSRWFQLNLGGGVDNPSAKVKAIAAALSIGAGF